MELQQESSQQPQSTSTLMGLSMATYYNVTMFNSKQLYMHLGYIIRACKRVALNVHALMIIEPLHSKCAIT